MSGSSSGSGNFVFQIPPQTYNQTYFSRLIRDLRQSFTTITSIQPTTVATLTITNCPTNGSGLRVGAVFSDGGVLKIVLPNTAYLPSFAIQSSLGQVTATGS